MAQVIKDLGSGKSDSVFGGSFELQKSSDSMWLTLLRLTTGQSESSEQKLHMNTC